MSRRPARYDVYPQALDFERAWRALVADAGGREQVVGRSVEGRALWRFDLGCPDELAPTFFLTALLHGVEVIGSLALHEVVRRLLNGHGRGLLERCRLVVMPIANPDAFAANMDRLDRGHWTGQRKNAAGVDLNRNFPTVGSVRPRHPFAGSSLRWSPHHRGPGPLSEPESRAIVAVAEAVRPEISLGFHSFGNLLLYPWGHTWAPNPRATDYQAFAGSFRQRLVKTPYKTGQAIEFYPTAGDLDDWLDHRFGTYAFTVEVGALDRRLFHPQRLFNAFCWMNPTDVEGTIANVAPAVVGLLADAAHESRHQLVA